jgi:phenylacetate-CoA ligase
MHIFSFWNYIEVLDNNNNSVKEDEEGRIIVTNLYNYSMPLIRYEIGDAAILGTKNCRCGSSLPVLQSITGRLTDHFITRDKKMIYGAYFRHLFFFKDWIKRYQIIQENYDTVRIKMVVNKNRAIELQEKQEIEDKIRFVMGNNCIVIWDVVEDISTTETGKYLYTQSLINR